VQSEPTNSLPIYIQWIGFFLAVFSATGVLLALPTLLQLLFGGPRLYLEFDSHDENGSRLLIVFIKNRPIDKPFGQFSFIRRDTIESLTATFQIVREDTHFIVVPVHRARIHSGEEGDELGPDRIRLPPTSSVGASIAVCRWNGSTGRAEIPATRGKGPTPLQAWNYEARMIFHFDGRRKDVLSKFAVGPTLVDLQWL
jgi:hypothetical protein